MTMTMFKFVTTVTYFKNSFTWAIVQYIQLLQFSIMSFCSSWSVCVTNKCGCEMHCYAPYIQSKMNEIDPTTTLMSSEILPSWNQVKIRKQLPIVSLVVHFAFAQLAGLLLCLWTCGLKTYFASSLISIFLLRLWFHRQIAEVTLLFSRKLGVQCSVRYFSGSWKHRPLISTNRIRALHLMERVTNSSVVPYLSLELTNHVPYFKETLNDNQPVDNKMVDLAFYMEPLFSLSSRHQDNITSSITEEAVIDLCLPLSSLVTIYRVGQAILFKQLVPAAF